MRSNFFKPTRIQSKKFFDKTSYGSDWDSLSKEVKERDKYTCKKCGYCQKTDKPSRRLEADHIVPLTKGGRNNLVNLQTLCELCHRKKTNLSNRNNKRRLK